MRNVKGIDIPETIGEEKTLSYKQLEDAAKVFNENAVSAEEINAAWDRNWWSGFNEALNLVYEVIHGMDWLMTYTPADVLNLIEQEADIYKRDNNGNKS